MTTTATTTPPVKLWRYSLPSVKHEGWAIIHLDSRGFFGAVSDYGNYAFLWTHPGVDDFRKFFDRTTFGDYFVSKLSHGCPKVFRPEESSAAIREAILYRRRHELIDREEAANEWEYARELEDGAITVEQWHDRTRLEEFWDLPVYGPPRDCEAFVEKVLPRLAEVIRAELAQEARVAA